MYYSFKEEINVHFLFIIWNYIYGLLKFYLFIKKNEEEMVEERKRVISHSSRSLSQKPQPSGLKLEMELLER